MLCKPDQKSCNYWSVTAMDKAGNCNLCLILTSSECSDESGTVFKVPVNCVTACLSSLQLCQSGLFNIWWQRQEQGQGPRFWFHLLQGCLPPASLRGNDCLISLPALASSLCDTFISPPAAWQVCVAGRAEPPLISVPAAMSSVRLNDASWQPDQCANKLGF